MIVFSKNGNLYFQDGNNPPARLTHVGEKIGSPKISDDNQKIVFLREDGSVYSINIDGTQEQIVIPGNWVDSFETGTQKKILDFVPGTHLLFFRTILCGSQDFHSLCSSSIFVADTDTGRIKKLADLGLSFQQNETPGNIVVSPDGRMVAVGTIDGIDIFTLDGNIIRRDIKPYTPNRASTVFPSLFWLPDSSELILAIPDTIYENHSYDSFVGNTLWRYTIDDSVAVQIYLDSPIPGGTRQFDISPDGNWSAYGGISAGEPTVYIGNLTDGHRISYGKDLQPSFSWGPDSKYFIYSSTNSILGSLGAPPLFLGNCRFQKWINADHFTCHIYEKNVEKICMVEIIAGAIKIYDLGFDKDFKDYVLIQQK